MSQAEMIKALNFLYSLFGEGKANLVLRHLIGLSSVPKENKLIKLVRGEFIEKKTKETSNNTSIENTFKFIRFPNGDRYLCCMCENTKDNLVLKVGEDIYRNDTVEYELITPSLIETEVVLCMYNLKTKGRNRNDKTKR